MVQVLFCIDVTINTALVHMCKATTSKPTNDHLTENAELVSEQ